MIQEYPENFIDGEGYALSEKQAESVFFLNCGDFRAYPNKPRAHKESENLPSSENDAVELQLASQFYTWLGSLDISETGEHKQREEDFLANLCCQEEYCCSVINRTDEILSKLQELKEKYDSVSEKTISLHDTCETLLQTQTDLSRKASEMEEKLRYFTNLNSIETSIASSSAVPSAERLQNILNSIDSSITFLEQNISFKDSPLYLPRFRACLVNALNIVKEGVKNTINRVVMELVDLGDAILPENSFILLYGRFRSQAPRIRSLMSLMETRIEISHEYSDAVTECQSFYLMKREALVQPVAQASISELISKYSSNHSELIRTTVSFMLHMCEDEISLFQRFFMPATSPALDAMLANLCRCNYNSLRPYLIHINHIEILTELCDLLRYEFLEEDTSTIRVELNAFFEMCHNLLLDIQQRLIFRAHIYIKSQIQDYFPCPGDLAYPEQLEMIEKISKSLQQSRKEEVRAEVDSTGEKEEETKGKSNKPYTTLEPLESSDFHGMWYPTVRRALGCISNLSRCLDVDTFQGLAQNCMSACIESLVKAQKKIAKMKTVADGHLFLIKHLLILREQMTPFNVEFRVKETTFDFSDLKSAAYMALPKFGSKLFDFNRANNLLQRLLEGPHIIDVEIDSRRQLDVQLKSTCEEFIANCVSTLTGDISAKLIKINELISSSPVSSEQVTQILGKPAELHDTVSLALRLLAAQISTSTRMSVVSLAGLRQKLLLYLSNKNTVSIIMRPIEAGVVDNWRRFSTILYENYSDEDRLIIGCPNESQIRLLFRA